jgi:predicted metal-dependent hydrolase
MKVEPADRDRGARSRAFLRGVELFNAGYYWEAHEAWEGLWHAYGRKGPSADVLKALIKLAAAGVKVREGQEHGVRTHAGRAAALFASAREQAGRNRLGLDLVEWTERAAEIAKNPPADPGPPHAPVVRVFAFQIEIDDGAATMIV